jgi:hypothetical protein
MAAERVADKVRANDCGWFVPRPEAYKGGGAAMAQAGRGALDALFGGTPARADAPQTPDDLFKKP